MRRDTVELRNKRVLVVGLGKSGLAAARFLKQQGARVTVSDARPATLIQELPALLEEGFAVEAGSHGLLTFRRQDLIVVSPGVPQSVPELMQVRAMGVPIVGELELGSQFLAGQVVAITGSNGKTTTTALVGKIFAEAGLPTLVGGNIGRPVTEMVAESVALSAQGSTVWSVLEVSSFQLETIDSFRPRIAVILNITPDHLDRHGSFEAYAAAKERIFENQRPGAEAQAAGAQAQAAGAQPQDQAAGAQAQAAGAQPQDQAAGAQAAGDALVLNADDARVQACAARARSEVFWFSASKIVRRGTFVREGVVMWLAREGGVSEPVLPLSEIPLAGAHNVENVLAAVCLARLAGVPAESVRRSVATFQAVEHRLEFVRELDGVRYFNDSKATNVDAAMKAIAAFAGGVWLILGGKDKNSDYTALAPLLRERVRGVITLGSAAEKIERQLAGVVKMESAGTLDRAVAYAREHAVAGDTVLLAPACASFDQFENYEHRGRVFKELVRAL